MKTLIKLFASASVIFTMILLNNYSADACTTFCLHTDKDLIFGRNYDWMIDYGIVFVNKRNVAKTAFTDSESPAKWISEFGSMTFNQFGREFPTGGMNEKGLVVELMWLEGSEFPDKDQRPASGGILQWIQYQLDICETVNEVIETDKVIRIPKNAVPVHFLVSDRNGNSATVEFLNGKMVVHSGEDLRYTVLTNDTYDNSLSYLNQLKEFGGNGELRNDNNSLYRFAKACMMLRSFERSEEMPAVDYGFKILSSVSQGEYTKWSIVYDIKNLKIYYRTFENRNIRNVDFSGLDFNCDTPVKMIGVNAGSEGNVNGELKDYSYESNRQLIEDSYGSVDFLKDTPDNVKELTAKYPERVYCISKSENKNFNSMNTSNKFSGLVLLIIVPVVFLFFFLFRKKLLN
ncbi:MAG: linear amide C-N hydrolase [Bacteroidetes bacterium]|nr:linear amide C-N hydrolase [Bacteroidota bacterium]